MKTFLRFLKEGIAYEKNIHLQHIEDLMFILGRSGLETSIQYLDEIIAQITAKDLPTSITVKTKIDGAPAVVCGINPENKQFFVGTKSVFNKIKPKVCYTNDDIDKFYSDKPKLADKLKVCLQYLPELDIKGVIQGDLLYTKEDLQLKNLNGSPHFVFKPNVIVYAVEKDSEIGKEIDESKMGIVFHTKYMGKTLPSLRANYNLDDLTLTPSPNVFHRDANFEDVFESISVGSVDVSIFEDTRNEIDDIRKNLDYSFLDKLETEPDLQKYMLSYINFLVRGGESQKSEKEKADGFIEYVKTKMDGELSTITSDSAIQKKKKKAEFINKILSDNYTALVDTFQLHNSLMELKLLLIAEFNDLQKQVKTFVIDNNKLVKTHHEGIVIVGDSGAVKLIDRDEFSRLNFTQPKDWK